MIDQSFRHDWSRTLEEAGARRNPENIENYISPEKMDIVEHIRKLEAADAEIIKKTKQKRENSTEPEPALHCIPQSFSDKGMCENANRKRYARSRVALDT